MSNIDKAMGDVSTARTLFTPRNINGVPFFGSADIVVHPDTITPHDYGFKAWAFDPAYSFAGGGTTAAVTVVTAVPLRAAASISNIIMNVASAGSGLTSGQCIAGIYSSAGNLLASTGDQSGVWNSTGYKTMALTGGPISIPAGLVYVAFFWNGTTGPNWATSVSTTGSMPVNAGTLTRAGAGATGRTTTLAASLGSLTGASALFWAAVS